MVSLNFVDVSLNKVLQGIRLIKFYAWEAFYTNQIGALREKELRTIRTMA